MDLLERIINTSYSLVTSYLSKGYRFPGVYALASYSCFLSQYFIECLGRRKIRIFSPYLGEYRGKSPEILHLEFNAIIHKIWVIFL